ncbi:unnamed protein product [Ectocarpus fasciculatus]
MSGHSRAGRGWVPWDWAFIQGRKLRTYASVAGMPFWLNTGLHNYPGEKPSRLTVRAHRASGRASTPRQAREHPWLREPHWAVMSETLHTSTKAIYSEPVHGTASTHGVSKGRRCIQCAPGTKAK